MIEGIDRCAVLARLVILVHDEDNACGLIFLDSKLFAATVDERMPRTSDCSIGLILMHEVAVLVHSVARKVKEPAGFIEMP